MSITVHVNSYNNPNNLVSKSYRKNVPAEIKLDNAHDDCRKNRLCRLFSDSSWSINHSERKKCRQIGELNSANSKYKIDQIHNLAKNANEIEIEKNKIVNWKNPRNGGYQGDQVDEEDLGYCHGTQKRSSGRPELSQVARKLDEKTSGRKTPSNIHSSTVVHDHVSFYHRHARERCAKSLEELPELHYAVARQNVGHPGGKTVKQLLAPRDNASQTYSEWLHHCEHCVQRYLSCARQSHVNNDLIETPSQASDVQLDASREMPLLYRSRSLPQLSVHDSGVASGQDNGPRSSRLVSELRQLLTLKQHYYPEGHWGWLVLIVGVLVQIIASGSHGAVGIFVHHVALKFNMDVNLEAGWLGAMSTGVALLISPVTIAFCRRKSTRVTAVLGGLVTALGCLFTSFASQFHQLFFSYGAVVGIGVGITRDCSTLMVAQYFKRKREFVEIFIVSGSGLGISVMSAFIKGAIGKIGWRLGLQAVTGVVFLTFILGTFYRSASLYHPQRRAILHLKNQKRKIKDKNKLDDKPPFFDFTTLKSKTVRILLLSTGISAFGITTPIFYLAHQVEEEGLGDAVVVLQIYLGIAWTVGCMAFGVLVVHHSVECRIARQYLTQTAIFMCGVCILALTAVHGNYHGYVMFTWIYGIFCGGYHYSLKMYTYERVRARNFARTWGFVQCSQALPIAIGVPISGYINVGCGGKAGYYFSSTCVLLGSFTLFFIDLHKRNLSKHKHTKANGTRHLCVSDSCPQKRRLSFSQDGENEVAAGVALALGTELASAPAGEKPELTCISEEGIADMDLPDNILDDMDYIGDCITSCNKVENYLMLSEFENNLIAEMPVNLERKGRRWSAAKAKGLQSAHQSGNNARPQSLDDDIHCKWHFTGTPANNRVITVIDEASTSNIDGS